MIFILTLSSFAASGATVFIDTHVHKILVDKATPQHNSDSALVTSSHHSMHSTPHSSQAKANAQPMENHDCCPEETLNTSKSTNASLCGACGDDCQCTQACHINATAAALKSFSYSYLSTSSVFTPSLQTSIAAGFLEKLERPPKTL